MQHNRITMLSSSETCHLGSSSNNPVIDQQSLLPSNPVVDEQNILPNTLESENYPHYLHNGHEVGMPSGSMIGQQNASLSLWDSAGSSSMGCLVDHDSLLQAKREHFSPALSIGGPLTIEGRRREGSSSLPSHNLNIDLNLNQADQFDTVNVDIVQNNGQAGMNFTLNRDLSSTEHVPRHEISSNAIGSSSQTANLFDGAAGQEVGVFGGHRSSIKRKNIAGSFAESSANGSSRNHHHHNNMLLPSPSTHETATSLNMHTSINYGLSYPPTEQLNRNTDASANAILSDAYSYSLSRHQHESERFLRNTRMRISANGYDQSLPSLLPEGSFRCSAYQPTQQQSSFVPVQPRVTSSSASSHNRPHAPAVAQFSQSLRRPRPSSNGNFGPRIGNSSSSADTINQRSASQDPSVSLTQSNLSEPLLLGSSLFTTDSTNLLSAPGSRSNQQNFSSSSSSTLQAAINVGPQQVPGLNASQPSSVASGSADTARRALLAASVSHSGGPGITLQHRGHSSSSHEIRGHQPGSISRANLQHYSRAVPPSIDRQNSSHMELQSLMQRVASRDGRTVSELRNYVEQIRQGRSAGRLEDLLVDRSLIRRANLIDRHREMRLDVDNMSYEELLALGERIGHVNTGLSEEKIMSGLKQWKYLHVLLVEPLTGVEPCCICQEDYVDGEDMGRLDCGHDFHTACIKQWLVIKNMCPICKKSALGT